MLKACGRGSWGLGFVVPVVLLGCGGKSAETQYVAAGGAVGIGGVAGGASATAGAPSLGGAGAQGTTIGGIPPNPHCADVCDQSTHWDVDVGSCVPNDGACLTAADCNSSLPFSCLPCPDGTPECAHHECVNGACEVVICAPAAPPVRVCGSFYPPCPEGMACNGAGDITYGQCLPLSQR